MGGHAEPSERHGSHLGYCIVMVVAKATAPFVLERREATLQFPEDSDYHGLEIRAKLDIDINTFLQFQKLGDSPGAEESRSLFEKFGGDIILEWNLHDEDAKPVPATADGFMTLPPNICIAMITAWAENVGSVGEA